MTEELKIKVRLDTSELKNGVKQIKDTLKDTGADFGGINKATQGATQSTKAVTAAMATMGATTVAQTAIMAKAMNKATASTVPLRQKFKQIKFDISVLGTAMKDIGKSGMDVTFKDRLELLSIGFKEVGKSAKEAGKQIKDNLGIALQNVKSSIKANMDSIKKSVLGAIAAITAFTAAIIHVSESTREFRQAMSQLNTSFIALGSNAETAAASYEAFYRILGDVRRSTEAANLLAQITTEEKDLVTWTKIATGALAMFPDSLPTESLIEASNETIKTGKVIGSLADALNWPADAANKISKALEGSAEAQSIFNKAIAQGMTTEDAFNAVLAETNSETQREIILRASLNGIYAQSAGLYEEMNRELIKQNEAQNRLNQVMAQLGSITQPVQTAFTNFKATLAEALAPAIKIVCDWLVTLINWLTTAAAWLGAFLSVIFPGAAEKISSAFKGASSSIKQTTSGTTGLKEGLKDAEGTAQKLRKTLMGFDELNVVSSMDSGGGSSASGGGAGGGAGNGIDVSGLDTGDSVFKKVQDQMEEMKKKAKEIWDEWKTEITIIAAALATLGVAGLLSGLGKAIGLGNTFLGIMNTIKQLAVSAITIVLQYSLVNEFMDKYIDGEGFKNYVLALLSAAVGTGLLYAMWGPAGAVVGLGVTAVASLKAIFDNGGVTNTESFIVLLTGIASAMGAITIAWKALGLKTIIANFGAFFALLKEGHGFVATLTAAFPALAGVITKIGTAVTAMGGVVKGAITAIGSFLSASWATISGLLTKALTAASGAITVALTAIKTAVVTVIKFLIANPIALIIAAIVALVALIAVKGDEIQKLLNKVSDWLKNIFVRDWRQVFGNTIGTILNGFVKIITDIMSNVKKILNGLIDFIRGVFTGDWKRAWEGIKQIFSGVFGGLAAIAKAPINAIITMINGLLSAVTSGLNAIKRALNTISVDIPDWVPKYGGKKFGFNFSMSSAPKIPMLATGGIIVNDTVARLGENGKKEAVLPLEQNTGWMDALADRLAARTSAPTKVVLKVGERELGYAVIDAINKNTKQTGGLKLQLV